MELIVSGFFWFNRCFDFGFGRWGMFIVSIFGGSFFFEIGKGFVFVEWDVGGLFDIF